MTVTDLKCEGKIIENISAQDDFIDLTDVSEVHEIEELKSRFRKLAARYQQTLKHLEEVQKENSDLHKQITMHQVRESALLEHIKTSLIASVAENLKENIDARLIN